MQAAVQAGACLSPKGEFVQSLNESAACSEKETQRVEAAYLNRIAYHTNICT